MAGEIGGYVFSAVTTGVGLVAGFKMIEPSVMGSLAGAGAINVTLLLGNLGVAVSSMFGS
ncbi:MAG: hypothetical protein SVU32_05295 [Candidatus Nanohaloarchaea archaeon]|nr:hypothetical protein [Candidatus Nanohaloarchaea archaeon]